MSLHFFLAQHSATRIAGLFEAQRPLPATGEARASLTPASTIQDSVHRNSVAPALSKAL